MFLLAASKRWQRRVRVPYYSRHLILCSKRSRHVDNNHHRCVVYRQTIRLRRCEPRPTCERAAVGHLRSSVAFHVGWIWLQTGPNRRFMPWGQGLLTHRRSRHRCRCHVVGFPAAAETLQDAIFFFFVFLPEFALKGGGKIRFTRSNSIS